MDLCFPVEAVQCILPKSQRTFPQRWLTRQMTRSTGRLALLQWALTGQRRPVKRSAVRLRWRLLDLELELD